MNKKIAIYVRVSTDDQVRTGYGLADQERRCQKYVELFYEDRLDDIEIYKDDGFSAKNFERPEIKRLLKDINSDLIDIVVVFKLDRLSRTVVDVYNFITVLLEKGCTLVAVLDHIDVSSANGRMFIGLMSCLGQWEREVIVERTVAGLVEMAEEGKYPCGGSRPYGWNINEEHYLVINKEEARVINYIVDLYLEGYSIPKIREKLANECNCNFGWNKIKRILQRKENIGEFFYHEKLYTNIFPPILSNEKYNEILPLLKKNQVTRENVHNYTFHHLVYCECGSLLLQQSTIKHTHGENKKYYYYYCPLCKKRISQNELEKIFLKKVYFLANTEDKDDRVKKLKQRLNQIKTKKSQLCEDFINQVFDKDAYVFAMNKFQIKENQVLNEIELIESNEVNINNLTEEEKYEIIHRIIKRIDVDTKTKKIINVDYKIIEKEE